MRLTIRLRTILIATVILVLLVLGWLWMRAATDSYDQRFETCMSSTQTVLYPRGHYWPDDAYNEAMQVCERRAGLPPQDTGNPNSWKEGK